MPQLFDGVEPASFGDRSPVKDNLFPNDRLSPIETLRRLASSPDNALELGKAAEHLVIADLILQGYRAYLTDQGLPYDIVVDLSGYLIRIQCKASCFARNVNIKGRTPRVAYSWAVKRRGKNGAKRLTEQDCEIVALVALDIRSIGYLLVKKCAQTIQIAPGGSPLFVGRKRRFSGMSAPLSSFTFESAIKDLQK